MKSRTFSSTFFIYTIIEIIKINNNHMKKFSNISGVKVAEEPKVEMKTNEEALFKAKVMNLMENLLSIRTYGPIDRYLRAGSIKITGKDLFLEALMDMLKDNSSNKEIKILESLKSSFKDWEVLDNKIDQLKSEINENKLNDKVRIHRKKIEYLLNNYSTDESMLMKRVSESCKKIKIKDTAYMRYYTINRMINEGKYSIDILEKISNRYKERAQEL